jgi:hypothetical protein
LTTHKRRFFFFFLVGKFLLPSFYVRFLGFRFLLSCSGLAGAPTPFRALSPSVAWLTGSKESWPGPLAYLVTVKRHVLGGLVNKNEKPILQGVRVRDFRGHARIWRQARRMYPQDRFQCFKCGSIKPGHEIIPIEIPAATDYRQEPPILCYACYAAIHKVHGFVPQPSELEDQKEPEEEEPEKGVLELEEVGRPLYAHVCPECDSVWRSNCCPSVTDAALGLCPDCYEYDGDDDVNN